MTFHLRLLLVTVSGLLLSATLGAFALPASGQEPPKTWPQIEAEYKDYKDKLGEGGPFDSATKAFFTEKALPQLATDANRQTIDRVRRRIRELMLTGITDVKAFEDASRTVREFMLGLARNDDAEPAVRVNAMLLVGELRTREGKPWPGAVVPLSTAVRDAKLPAGVRLAALAGLARHADAVRTADGDTAAAFAKDAAPAVLSIIAAAAKPPLPAAPRTADTSWMTARALTILPVVAPAAPKDLAAAVVAIMGDASWPIDVRVRAAAALGATATAQSGVNAGQAIEAVRVLAKSALEGDIASAERRRADREYRGGGGQAAAPPGFAPPGFGFGGPLGAPAAANADGMAEQIVRRDAWRMATLADAILDADGDRGLAKLLGKDGEAAAALATTLRENALSLDAEPTESGVAAALESLAAPQAAAAAKPAPAADKPAPGATEPEPAASPFDASPFGQ